MSHLSIQNLGPIVSVDIDLNRINVFIGPQSSGKSTIAKVISFCQWLEKDCLKRQKIIHVDESFTLKRFVEYHNISDYLNEKTSFKYSGPALEIEYLFPKLTVKRTVNFKDAKISKNAYIPSERNVISIPGIFSTKMPENYLASFLDDWQIIRSKYKATEKVPVLDLGESYYFDEKSQSDMLVADGDKTFHLSQASSGLQSITPLCVYISYLTDWIYNHEEERSSDDRKQIREAAIARVIANKSKVEEILDVMQNPQFAPEIANSFQTLKESFQNVYESGSYAKDPEIAEFTKMVAENESRLCHPQFSNIVIEEPEQNIFPQTQTSLIYAILSMINNERDTLVITTHSPFILYALNNCMLAGKVMENISDDLLEHISVPKEAWIDPDKVSVWELRDGHIQTVEGNFDATIQDSDNLIRSNYFDRVMHNVMADFNGLINFLD